MNDKYLVVKNNENEVMDLRSISNMVDSVDHIELGAFSRTYKNR